jgi:hypothetical protein
MARASAGLLGFRLQCLVQCDAVFPLGVYWGWLCRRQGLVVGNVAFAVLGVDDVMR